MILLNLSVLFFHELGHVTSAKVHDINFTISMKSDGLFGPGAFAIPLSNSDIETYNNLSISQKSDILLAGIRSDIIFMGILAFILLNFSAYLAKKYKMSLMECSIMFILICFILLILYATYNNFFQYKGDVYNIIHNSNFSLK
jgi:hypothetical protein